MLAMMSVNVESDFDIFSTSFMYQWLKLLDANSFSPFSPSRRATIPRLERIILFYSSLPRPCAWKSVTISLIFTFFDYCKVFLDVLWKRQREDGEMKPDSNPFSLY